MELLEVRASGDHKSLPFFGVFEAAVGDLRDMNRSADPEDERNEDLYYYYHFNNGIFHALKIGDLIRTVVVRSSAVFSPHPSLF